MAVLATFHTGKSFRVWCECPGNFRLILRSNIACASVNTGPGMTGQGCDVNTRCFISWFQSNCCLQTSILNVVSAIFTWGSSIRDNNNNNKKTPLWSGMTGEGSDVYVTLNCLRRKQLSWSDNHLIGHAGIFVGAIWEAWRWPCNISRLRGSDQSCNDGNSENDGTWGVMFNTRHPTCRNNLFYVARGDFAFGDPIWDEQRLCVREFWNDRTGVWKLEHMTPNFSHGKQLSPDAHPYTPPTCRRP